jgi:hypothetical protein
MSYPEIVDLPESTWPIKTNVAGALVSSTSTILSS